MAEVQSISLYRYNGPKALICPLSQANATRIFQQFSSPELQQAIKTPRGDGGCCFRLKFQTGAVWMDHQSSGVTSRRVLLDLITVMQRQNMQLLCCADLVIAGSSAGTFFFQRITDPQAAACQKEQQLACLQLGHVDKLRIVQLPEAEIQGLEHTLSSSWRHGFAASDKYGTKGYKLTGRPWSTTETSNSLNLDAHKLVLKILEYMETNGWSRVVSFDCTTSDYDADSLLFFRDASWTRQRSSEFCAVSLERHHKIRLWSISIIG